MRFSVFAVCLAALPFAAVAQPAPDAEEMVTVIGTVFPELGCSLDISDGEASELVFATAIAEEIGATPEQVLNRDDGGLYGVVGDALDLMFESGALVFDEQMTTLSMPECEPSE